VSFLRAIECPKCGAPLDDDAFAGSVVVCPYCDGTSATDPRVVLAAKYEAAFRRGEEGGDLRVRGVPFAIERKIGEGSTCDVFAGKRLRGPGERVIIKIRRSDASFLPELRVLRELSQSEAPGFAHFRDRLPHVVSDGVRESDRAPVLVFRHLSGFEHTLVDVRSEHGDALDPRHGAWIFRRILELLSWVHACGFAHGAIAPEHVVVNARDHGAMLVGWSKAERGGDPSRDVAAAAQAIGWLLGAAAPHHFAMMLLRFARGGDAIDAERECVAAARKDFGPSRFVPLHLSRK
jgi:serine/threonine protein kinase